MFVTAAVGFEATLISILLAMLFPPAEVRNILVFEVLVIGACILCPASDGYLCARAQRARPGGQR